MTDKKRSAKDEISKERAERLYIKEGMSASEIGRYTGYSASTIANLLFNEEIKTCSRTDFFKVLALFNRLEGRSESEEDGLSSPLCRVMAKFFAFVGAC